MYEAVFIYICGCGKTIEFRTSFDSEMKLVLEFRRLKRAAEKTGWLIKNGKTSVTRCPGCNAVAVSPPKTERSMR